MTVSYTHLDVYKRQGKTPFSVRPESPEGTVLPWPKVQRRIAQLIKEDRFYTEAEQDRFDNYHFVFLYFSFYNSPYHLSRLMHLYSLLIFVHCTKFSNVIVP